MIYRKDATNVDVGEYLNLMFKLLNISEEDKKQL